ncbi:unnamed protein product [Adineta steineri]|uniref:Uncharacterized protein n=2 Tax=Adineta steineri TaxID=433720 RepID=A0A819UPA4_9BILA|nr:unnamed protein product [Adineta steineri]CAF4099067.1 unnamed protein product [Adineta steineri]
MFCQHHTNEHQETLDRRLQSLVTDTDQITNQLSEEQIQLEYVKCWADIDLWEQGEIENIQRTADLMRQEVTDAVGECLFQPRQELGLLLDSLDLARDNLKKFDEIDLNQWEELLDRVKTLAKFVVTFSNFDDGLELLVTGKQLEDLTSFEDNTRHSIGLVPVSYPQLQRINHREVNEPVAQLRRSAAAEIPFERRSFYPLRWRVSV